jgi:hypothetical protein
MVWLFPEGCFPITVANIAKRLALANKKNSCLIEYFSPMPFMLQMMAEDVRASTDYAKWTLLELKGQLCGLL